MQLGEYYGQKAVYRKVSRGRLNGILALAGDLKGKKVLDLGCGAGEVGAELKKRGATVHGLDISAAAVEQAAGRLDGAAVFDFESNNWPSLVNGQAYDLIIVSEVLEHLFRPEDALKKIKQKFSCPVIVTVPNVLFWQNRLKIFFGSFEYTETGLMDRGHVHFFSWPSFKKLTSQVGYEIEAVAHHQPTRGTSFLGRVWPGLYAHNFIVRMAPCSTLMPKNS